MLWAVSWLEMREKDVLAENIAGAEPDLSDIEVLDSAQFILAAVQSIERQADMIEQNLTFDGECDAAGAAFKQSNAEVFFQLADRLAYGGLADKQFFCGVGDITGFGNGVKNTILRQMLFHSLLLQVIAGITGKPQGGYTSRHRYTFAL